MQRRNTKQILPDQLDIDEPSPKIGPRESNKVNSNSILNILWMVIKVVLILFVIFPFIDKIRHKDYFSKAINLFHELDIGCKPCICPTYNVTQSDDKKGTGF